MHKSLLFLLIFLLVASFAAPGVSASNHQPIPDTFEVGKYLKAKDQKSFLPATNATGDDAVTGSATEPKGLVGFLVFRVINTLVQLIASVALIVFVIGGLMLITAGGKEEQLEKGKTAMTYALIGLAAAFLSFLIVTFVQSVLTSQ